MAKQPRYMSDCEIRLVLQWYHEDDVSVEEICRRLRRSERASERVRASERERASE